MRYYHYIVYDGLYTFKFWWCRFKLCHGRKSNFLFHQWTSLQTAGLRKVGGWSFILVGRTLGGDAYRITCDIRLINHSSWNLTSLLESSRVFFIAFPKPIGTFFRCTYKLLGCLFIPHFYKRCWSTVIFCNTSSYVDSAIYLCQFQTYYTMLRTPAKSTALKIRWRNNVNPSILQMA